MLDCQPPIQVLAELEVGSVASDPLRAGALSMRLRFICVGGGSRKWAVALLGVHPLEKSTRNFKDTSIHRFLSWL
jgi:hypothetical protein